MFPARQEMGYRFPNGEITEAMLALSSRVTGRSIAKSLVSELLEALLDGNEATVGEKLSSILVTHVSPQLVKGLEAVYQALIFGLLLGEHSNPIVAVCMPPAQTCAGQRDCDTGPQSVFRQGVRIIRCRSQARRLPRADFAQVRF